MTNKFLLIMILLLVVRIPSAEMDYEDWLNATAEIFQHYKDERDREFTDFLKKAWQEIQFEQGEIRDKKPKPVKIPITTEKDEPIYKGGKPVEIKVSNIKSEKKTKIEKHTPPVNQQEIAIKLRFFGSKLKFSYEKNLVVKVGYPINKDKISAYWERISKAEYKELLKQLQYQINTLELNDWGYALLINKVATQLFSDKNNRTLFTWFLLTKSGYTARIALNSNKVYLLLASKQKLYDVSYFDLDEERYYVIDFSGGKSNTGRVFTYKKDYPGTTHKIDMTLRKSPRTGRTIQQKQITFRYLGKIYRVNIGNDMNAVRFLNTYPQMEIDQYFYTGMNDEIGKPLLQQLAKIIEGRSQIEAANILLRFVQAGFEYKTDEQQFGYENYLFPEETLFYPYSDCEDRAVLFSWVIRELLGLKVIGLSYPGHIATAIKLEQDMPGDTFVYKKDKYIIADPTFVNANIGKTMPQYKNIKPEIISI